MPDIATTTTETRAAKIARLNDAFRTSLDPKLGTVSLSAGVDHLVRSDPRDVLAKVRAFSAFEPGDDPYGEHDFGAFQYAGERLFWKVDYYEKGSNFEFGSEHPDNADKTDRVLTIMLADEY